MKSDVFAAKENGVWQTVQHLQDDVVSFGAEDEPHVALRATFALTDSEGIAGFSQLLLTSISGLFVKVRLSFVEEGDDDWNESIALLLGWLSELLRSQDAETEDSEDPFEFAPAHQVRLEVQQLLDPSGTVINSIGMKLVPVPPGEFWMGGRPGEDGYDPDEEFLHRVRITRPFLMGMFQVMQGEYAGVIGSNPSTFHGKTRPVERVTWKQAVEFCRKLSHVPAEQKAGRFYRLPTEAEWERACRAGSSQAYSFGSELSRSQANYCESWVATPQPTYPAGMFPPNAFGLFDMHGNVWEWCSDWFSAEYYRVSPIENPTGPTTGTHHALRGGSASVEVHECRCGMRGEAPSDGPKPSGKSRFEVIGDFGFRVVCELRPNSN